MKDPHKAAVFRSQTGLTGHTPQKEAFFLVLASIPAGRVSSYGKIAELAGMGKRARLVGRWLGQLPDDTQLPWHRVLNSQGKLSLPADSPSGAKQRARLLAEGVLVRDGRVNLGQYAWP